MPGESRAKYSRRSTSTPPTRKRLDVGRKVVERGRVRVKTTTDVERADHSGDDRAARADTTAEGGRRTRG
jgi:hypothetical protein